MGSIEGKDGRYVSKMGGIINTMTTIYKNCLIYLEVKVWS